jgi:uncharacterized protein
MAKKLPFLIIIVFFFVCLAIGLFWKKHNTSTDLSYETKTVSINDTKILALVADSSEKQALGLGKRTNLEKNSGMLFPFNPKQDPSFWMKDMLIPIDIIWISDGNIVKIDQDVPNLPIGTSDDKLADYSAGLPIDYVLEVNAGFCSKNNIKVGDELVFD